MRPAHSSTLELVESVIRAERTTRKLSAVLPLEHRLRRAFGVYWRAQGKRTLVTLARFAPDFPELKEAVDPTELDQALGRSIITDPALAQLVQIVAEQAMDAGMASAQVDLAVEAAFSVSHPEAVAWLTRWGAARVANIDDVTRQYLKTIVTSAADEGWSYQRTAKAITDRFVQFAIGVPQEHIRSRAELVAVTEVGTAYEKGASIVAAGLQAQGLVIEKAWLDVGDEAECPECEGNAADGWIGEDDAYSSGDVEPPAHPACRCTNERRVAGDESTVTKDSPAGE